MKLYVIILVFASCMLVGSSDESNSGSGRLSQSSHRAVRDGLSINADGSLAGALSDSSRTLSDSADARTDSGAGSSTTTTSHSGHLGMSRSGRAAFDHIRPPTPGTETGPAAPSEIQGLEEIENIDNETIERIKIRIGGFLDFDCDPEIMKNALAATSNERLEVLEQYLQQRSVQIDADGQRSIDADGQRSIDSVVNPLQEFLATLAKQQNIAYQTQQQQLTLEIKRNKRGKIIGIFCTGCGSCTNILTAAVSAAVSAGVTYLAKYLADKNKSE